MRHNRVSVWVALALLGSVVSVRAERPVPTWTAPQLDHGKLIAEDLREKARPGAGLPLRVGRPQAAGLTPATSGTWEASPDGGRVWRVAVRSPGALWLVLTFDRFELPAGASLRVLDASGLPQLHPFTAADRLPQGGLGLPPLSGEELQLELYWPAPLDGVEPLLRLGSVLHGYRPIAGVGETPAAVAASAVCNSDVVCPLGAAFDDQRRGVVKILTGGGFFCSGALVNDTSLDCTPYVLTAEHCYDPPGTGTGISQFIFNYDTPSCGGGAAPTNQTITGAQLVASSDTSDFRLMKLNQSPVALGYDVYFNGWSRSASAPTSGATIHHPEGDVKKIARDNGPLVSDTGTGGFGPAFWRVNQWDQGTTESGSSGAPLYDQNRRIVGQLRGGSAVPCTVPGFSAFGKLSVSWAGDGTSTSRLSDWLDPSSTGAVILNGMRGSFCGALAPRLSITGTSVDDAPGNNNGVSEPGDLLKLTIDVLNDGPLTATAVSGTLSTSDPAVTVVVGQAQWVDIPSGQTAETSAPGFTLELDPAIGCARSIPFDVVLSSKQGDFASSFLLELGTDTGQTTPFFVDHVESGTNGWTTQLLAGSNPWSQSSLDSLSPTKSWRIADPATGPHDSVLRLPVQAALPAAAVLRFSHHMQSQLAFDGGVLELSADGVDWQDAGPFVTQGGYNGVISQGSSPLAGRAAWTGDLGGWLPVEVDLAAFEGQSLHARWRFATDALGGGTAWAIDDVSLETRVHTCAAPNFPWFPGAKCRGTHPPAGGGKHRSSLSCIAPRPN
jgi:hypothetical protein